MEKTFGLLGVCIADDQRLLDSCLGNNTAQGKFVLGIFNQWVANANVEHLSCVAMHQPQAAYAALIKSLQHEWCYLYRIVPDCNALFTNIEKVLLLSFLPAPFDCDVSRLEQHLSFWQLGSCSAKCDR